MYTKEVIIRYDGHQVVVLFQKETGFGKVECCPFPSLQFHSHNTSSPKMLL